MEWTITEDKDNESFELLITIISESAEKTDILQIPTYQHPSKLTILNCLKKIVELKDNLKEEDSIIITVPGNEPIHMDQSSHINTDLIEELITVNKEISHHVMKLIVKKPDYIESSMWEFRHEKSLSAKIEDEKWLQSFQNNEIIVYPGDSLQCRVRTEKSFSDEGDLLNTKYYIEEVMEVIRKTVTKKEDQLNLLESD